MRDAVKFFIIVPNSENAIDAKSKKILGKTIWNWINETLEKSGIGDYQTEVVSNIPKRAFADNSSGDVVIMYGYMPNITPQTISRLIYEHRAKGYDITVVLDPLEKEQYSRLYCLNDSFYQKSVDAINVASSLSSHNMGTIPALDSLELFSVSENQDMFHMIAKIKKQLNELHVRNGVELLDPVNTYIDCSVKIGKGTVVYPNNYIEGNTEIGENCVIGPNCRLTDMIIQDNTKIQFSVAEKSIVGQNCDIGPFTYIRPDSKIGNSVKIGDFVEIKNSVISNYTKISHLSYIGDSDVGENVNFGCGTFTANYDGKHKTRSVIGNNAFVGCDTNLVSPVNIGEGAYIAAGSTITDDVPDKNLAIARTRQVNKKDWKGITD